MDDDENIEWLADRAERDPDSLTPDEIQRLSLHVLESQGYSWKLLERPHEQN